MDLKLIERYVEAVKTFLPGAQRDDIGRELTEDLLSRMEAQEEKLGRPLTDAEQETVLKKMGNPTLVAGRYNPNNLSLSFGRQIIGPELFPLYLRVLGISLILMLAGRAVALYFVGMEVAEGVLGYTLAHFAIVTVIFAIAQYQLTHHPDQWNPREPLSLPTAPKGPPRVSRTDTIIELVIISAILLWLRSVSADHEFMLGELSLGPIWRQMYWPVVALNLVSLVPPAVNLFRPRWLTFRLASKVVLGVVWLGIMAFMYQAGAWVSLAQATAEQAAKVAMLNQYIGYGLLITLAIAGVMFLVDVFILLRHLRRRAPATTTVALVM
jgi:hypothetical protein